VFPSLRILTERKRAGTEVVGKRLRGPHGPVDLMRENGGDGRDTASSLEITTRQKIGYGDWRRQLADERSDHRRFL